MQVFQDRNSRALIYDAPAFGTMGSSPWPAESTGPACCETKGCDPLVNFCEERSLQASKLQLGQKKYAVAKPLLLATLRKNVAVEHSVVDRFLDMVCLDRFYRFQVRDGTRHS